MITVLQLLDDRSIFLFVYSCAVKAIYVFSEWDDKWRPSHVTTNQLAA